MLCNQLLDLGHEFYRYSHHRNTVAVVGRFVFGNGLVFRLVLVMVDDCLNLLTIESLWIPVRIFPGRVCATVLFCRFFMIGLASSFGGAGGETS